MKLNRIWTVPLALCVSAVALGGQEAGEVEKLKQQLQQVQESFRQSQAEHQKQIDAMLRQLEALQQEQSATELEQEKLKLQVAAPPPSKPPAAAPQETPDRPWSPADAIRLAGGPQAYLNLSLAGLFAAGGSTASDIEGGTQLGGHDPKQRGFTVQNVELTLDGKVDPYFRGQANVILQIDPEGETKLELEEAFMESLSLPANLQLKVGQYFTEFGRLNPQHPHAWAFVDQPLVNGRFLGADGLRNAGARLSWLAPTPFYSELFANVQNSQGETATSFRSEGFEGPHPLPFAFRPFENDRGVKNLDDMLFTARYATSFDLTDTQTLLGGVSGAWGPNSSGTSGDARTRIYGLDLFWKWKPVDHHGGFPFVSWQTEVMLRKYEAGSFDGDFEGDGALTAGDLADSTGMSLAALPGETLTDYGFYSQLLYGFRKGWVAGLRFEYLDGDRGSFEQAGLLISDGAGGGAPSWFLS